MLYRMSNAGKVILLLSECFFKFSAMGGGALASLPKPKRIHVILSKMLGGTMVFWILWRLKHDWHDLVVSFFYISVTQV